MLDVAYVMSSDMSHAVWTCRRVDIQTSDLQNCLHKSQIEVHCVHVRGMCFAQAADRQHAYIRS